MGCRISSRKTTETSIVNDLHSLKNANMNSFQDTFTEAQKKIVKETWNIVREDIAKIGVVTFLRLFEKSPDLQDLFVPFRGMDIDQLRHDEGLREHGLRVMGTIEKCVARLDNQKRFEAMLNELGQKHIVYNIKPEYFELLGPQLITAIKPAIGDQWTSDVEEAWINFYSVIVQIMKTAMMP